MRKGKYSIVFSLFLALTLTSRLPVLAQENASPLPRSSAEDVGMSSEKLRQAVTAAQDWVNDDKMVGAVMLVIRHDKVVLHEAVGWSDKEQKIPMKVDAIFGMRSMTKPLVGTAILMLLEEGRLLLQDKVSQYLPSFDNPITPAQLAVRPYRARSKNITVYQLLTHTSGLTGHFLDLDRPQYASLREVADDVGRMGPSFKPGTDYEYSNIGSSTLGALIAEISGMPAQEFIQKRILDPLQMKDSFFSHIRPDHLRRSRVAATYRRESGKWKKTWDNSQESTVFGRPSSPQLPRVPFFPGSGGLLTTAMDYAKFMSMMLHRGRVGTKQFLSPVTVNLATSPHSAYVYDAARLREMDSFYGLHWTVYTDKYRSIVGPASPGTFGHGGALGTSASADPDQGLIEIYLTQSPGSQTSQRFSNLVYAAVVE